MTHPGRVQVVGESVDGVADVPGQSLMGNFNQLRKLKEANPQLTFLISIRGWSDSTNFSRAAATTESRRKVVGTCIDMLLDGDLPDGDTTVDGGR